MVKNPIAVPRIYANTVRMDIWFAITVLFGNGHSIPQNPFPAITVSLIYFL